MSSRWTIVVHGAFDVPKGKAAAWKRASQKGLAALAKVPKPGRFEVKVAGAGEADRVTLRGYQPGSERWEGDRETLLAALGAAAEAGGKGTVIIARLSEELDCTRVHLARGRARVEEVDDEEDAAALGASDAVRAILKEWEPRPKAKPVPAEAAPVAQRIEDALREHGLPMPPEARFGGHLTTVAQALEVLDGADHAAALALAEEALPVRGLDSTAAAILARSDSDRHLDLLVAQSSALVGYSTHPARDARLLAAFEPLCDEVVKAAEAGTALSPKHIERFAFLAWQLAGGQVSDRGAAVALPAFERLAALGRQINLAVPVAWGTTTETYATLWRLRATATVPQSELTALLQGADDTTLHYLIELLLRDHPKEARKVVQSTGDARAKEALRLLEARPRGAAAGGRP
jgi:hypothetical protein